MNVGWFVFGACVIFILAAAIPLLKERGSERRTPLPPRQEPRGRQHETLRGWRDER
ncbi:hypothetical protein [Accumulibacter sp.]|uniref:hypothetical protein n=1 Tax=Accumulibacter sp. TaxID=2053492 RepID=UPI0025DDC344|nr:hypothetical protein [Accumulibacter sp.]MCM8596602.1 hypothetical protein [Accumulibacter sp.]MCM8627521.1 hypothetical protein [Accumulibacter sp.]MDS4050750.1 hypothetical protein [Accumulibacter sp.]